MANLPIFQHPDPTIVLLQTKWKQEIQPALQGAIIQGQYLTGINLINGTTVINHLLGRQMQGWMIGDIDAAATIYRSAPLNAKTLTLTSNAATSVSLWVF
jgi:hypothetical protein